MFGHRDIRFYHKLDRGKVKPPTASIDVAIGDL